MTKETQEQILVADAKLGSTIKDKFGVSCLASTPVQELMRGIRSQMSSLIGGIPEKEMTAFALGLCVTVSSTKIGINFGKLIYNVLATISSLSAEDYICQCFLHSTIASLSVECIIRFRHFSAVVHQRLLFLSQQFAVLIIVVALNF